MYQDSCQLPDSAGPTEAETLPGVCLVGLVFFSCERSPRGIGTGVEVPPSDAGSKLLHLLAPPRVTVIFKNPLMTKMAVESSILFPSSR